LSTCVTAVKDSLTKVIFPVIEGLASDSKWRDHPPIGADVVKGIESKLLAHVVHAESASAHKGKSPKKHSPFFKNPALSEISQTCCTTVPRLTSLINKPDMAFSDSLVIQAVYLAIGPLFINEPSTKKGRGKEGNASGRHAGLSVLKSLRMEALGCLRAVSAGSPQLRRRLDEDTDLCKIRPSATVDHRGDLELARQDVEWE